MTLALLHKYSTPVFPYLTKFRYSVDFDGGPKFVPIIVSTSPPRDVSEEIGIDTPNLFNAVIDVIVGFPNDVSASTDDMPATWTFH